MPYLNYRLRILKRTYDDILKDRGLPDGRTIHDLIRENSFCSDPRNFQRNELDMDYYDRATRSVICTTVTADETGKVVGLNNIPLRPEELRQPEPTGEKGERNSPKGAVKIESPDLAGIEAILDALKITCSREPDSKRKQFARMLAEGVLQRYLDAGAIQKIGGRWFGYSKAIEAVSRNGTSDVPQ